MTEKMYRILATLALLGSMFALHYSYEVTGWWAYALGVVCGLLASWAIGCTIEAAKLGLLADANRKMTRFLAENPPRR